MGILLYLTQAVKAPAAASPSSRVGALPAGSPVFFAVRLTLNIMPTQMQLMRMLEPPRLMRGSGYPVTGIAPTATAILTIACRTIMSDSPITR